MIKVTKPNLLTIMRQRFLRDVNKFVRGTHRNSNLCTCVAFKWFCLGTRLQSMFCSSLRNCEAKTKPCVNKASYNLHHFQSYVHHSLPENHYRDTNTHRRERFHINPSLGPILFCKIIYTLLYWHYFIDGKSVGMQRNNIMCDPRLRQSNILLRLP